MLELAQVRKARPYRTARVRVVPVHAQAPPPVLLSLILISALTSCLPPPCTSIPHLPRHPHGTVILAMPFTPYCAGTSSLMGVTG